MMRRLFLKLFGGAGAAAAVTVGPKVAEAVQRAKDEPLNGAPFVVNPKARPRNIRGFGVSDDLLYSLGFTKEPTKRDCLRIDEILKSAGEVPLDAVLEVVFPQEPMQCVMIFRYRHDSFPLVRSCDVIWNESVDTSKCERFFKQ